MSLSHEDLYLFSSFFSEQLKAAPPHRGAPQLKVMHFFILHFRPSWYYVMLLFMLLLTAVVAYVLVIFSFSFFRNTAHDLTYHNNIAEEHTFDVLQSLSVHAPTSAEKIADQRCVLQLQVTGSAPFFVDVHLFFWRVCLVFNLFSSRAFNPTQFWSWQEWSGSVEAQWVRSVMYPPTPAFSSAFLLFCVIMHADLGIYLFL